MLHIMIKKSFAREINKAMRKDNLEALKKEIISILEKKESQEYKKAIEFFEETENHYTHLEKSITGEWIEKAGYGVGTVRIWKGKKYKKVAPKKWVRVFDKMDRGAKGSMTRLINKVKACNSEEELYQFCMSNHSIFQDENGNDLPIMDKLRAAIDEQSGKLESGKNIANPIESKADKYKKLQEEFKQEIADGKRNNTKELQEDVNEWKNLLAISNKDPNAYSKEQVEHFKEIIKIGQEELDKRNEKKNKKSESKEKTFEQEMDQLYEIQDNAWEGFTSGNDIKSSPENSKKFYDKVKKFVDNNNIRLTQKHYEEIEDKNGHSFNEALALAGAYGNERKEKALADNIKWNKEYKTKYNAMINLDLSKVDEFKDKVGNYSDNKESERVDENTKLSNGKTVKEVREKYGIKTDKKESEKFWNGKVESEVGEGDFVAEMKGIGGGLYRNRFKTKAEAEKSTKNHQALGFESHVVEDRKESEQEKHQNRSDAMKGNKNAYKGGAKEIAKYINSKTNNDKERNELLLEALAERYGTKNNKYAMESVSELYSKVKQAKRNSQEWYDAVNNYDEASEMYKMVIGDNGIDYYNSEVEKERMKPNYNTDKLAYKGVLTPSESTDIDKKTPISTNKKSDENEVTMPYSKELEIEMKTLKNGVSQDPYKKIMNYVYYDDGNLISTDARKMKVVKVGKLDGIENGSYVDIDSSKEGIKIKKIDIDETDVDGNKINFPVYKKVIPNNLTQKASLNNDLVKSKIKEMLKDGAIDKKTKLVQLEFKDGKILIDDTVVGDAPDVKLEGENGTTNYLNINADYLLDSISGKESTLMLADKDTKAVAISTESTTNVIMPMYGNNEKKDYSEGRKNKEKAKKQKEENKKVNKKYIESYIDSFFTPKDQIEKVYKNIDNQDEDVIKRAIEALNDAEKLLNNPPSNVMSSQKLNSNRYGFQLLNIVRQKPEFKLALQEKADEYGIDYKKSLFDIIDIGIIEDEDDEEDKKNFIDNDASQPELFNSVSYKVSEALNSVFGC